MRQEWKSDHLISDGPTEFEMRVHSSETAGGESESPLPVVTQLAVLAERWEAWCGAGSRVTRSVWDRIVVEHTLLILIVCSLVVSLLLAATNG